MPILVAEPELSVAQSYQYALRLTRSAARNFFYSFWFLTPERRRSIAAVYAFSRRLDDCVDAVEDGKLDRKGAIAGLADLGKLLDADDRGGDPLGPALRDTIRRFAIPLEPFRDLIRGMEMDLEVSSYQSFEELRTYCYRAASTVGLICIEIFGHDGGEARERATDLGIAMQLTNIIRDIPEDLRRERLYLPREDLLRFGYREEELRAGIRNDRFRALMAFQVERAREYFRRAEGLLPRLCPESRRCPALLARFYQAILTRIERSGYDVFSRRPRLPLLHKLALAGSQLFSPPRLAPR